MWPASYSLPVAGITRQAPLLGKLWLAIPARLRLAIYLTIWKVTDKLFPRQNTTRVRLILPGIYLKGGTIGESEPHAMMLIRRHTDIRTSVALDYIAYTIPSRHTPNEPYHRAFLLMTALEGETLETVQDTLSESQVSAMAADLRRYLCVLRGIPNPYPKSICSASGGALDVPRLSQVYQLQPFDDVRAFHEWLRWLLEDYWSAVGPTLEPIFSKYDEAKPVFIHGDLSPDNIMTKNGRFVGLIDWETSGWMPPYWEHVSARWTSSPVPKTIITSAFPKDYETERRGLALAAGVMNGRLPEDFK